jgi:hypothetical protein
MVIKRPTVVAVMTFVLMAGAGAAWAADADGDGMPDKWERRHGLSPTKPSADGDPDRDRLRNIDEYLNHGDPQSSDTDGDGLLDGNEIRKWGTRVDVADAIVGRTFADVVCIEDGECGRGLLGGARLTLEPVDGSSAPMTSLSNENGKFSFRAPEGRYTLTPAAIGGFATPDPVEVVVHDTAVVATFFYGEETGPGLVGQVTQSPTCPGPQRVGQDCVDPLENAPIRIENAAGETVAETTSGDGGRYYVDLAAGSYSVVAEPIGESSLPAPPAEVSITISGSDPGPTVVNLDYDTGIR